MGQNQTTKKIQTSFLISTKEKIQTSLQYQGENSNSLLISTNVENSNFTSYKNQCRKFKLHSL